MSVEQRRWALIKHPHRLATDFLDVVITSPSDGQVLEYDSGTSSWVNATLAGNGRIIKYKTSDTNKSSDTTQAADPHLSGFSLAANTLYTVDAVLFITSSTTTVPDLALSFTCSTAPVYAKGGHVTSTEPSGAPTGNTFADLTSTAANTVPVGTGSTGVHYCVIRGIVSTGASTTTVDLAWAQRMSNASVISLKTGSWLSFSAIS